MGYIYLITNDINGKQYIGKTEKENIQERWKEHCNDYNKQRNEKRPLYNAMNKYGIEHFHIQKVEYIPPDINLEEREKYWIEYYNTYYNGYNATKGGDGKHYLDYELIIKTYQNLQAIDKTANYLNISTDSVSMVLQKYNILINNYKDIMKERYGKKVGMYKENKLINSFLSLKDAARYIVENNITKSTNIKNIAVCIGRVCTGERKTAYNYKWHYL